MGIVVTQFWGRQGNPPGPGSGRPCGGAWGGRAADLRSLPQASPGYWLYDVIGP